MMKERPILMHARSINGILENRKTQTRRIVKPQPLPAVVVRGWCASKVGGQADLWNWLTADSSVSSVVRCPYGKPGDRLWVRETWAMNDIKYGWGSIPKQLPRGFGGIVYRADGEWKDQFAELDGGIPPWRPSIFMPRWASRLTLEITNIRAERIQDISEEDVRAEGVQIPVSPEGRPLLNISTNNKPKCRMYDDPMNATLTDYFIGNLAMLWDDTNGKGAWERNDWCWVVEFKRV